MRSRDLGSALPPLLGSSAGAAFLNACATGRTHLAIAMSMVCALLVACAPTRQPVDTEVGPELTSDTPPESTPAPPVVPPTEPPSTPPAGDDQSSAPPTSPSTTPVLEPTPPSSPAAALPGTGDTIAPDSETLRRAEAAATETISIETAQTIDASTVGLVGDGRTDNTDVLRDLLAGGNRTILIPAGDYVTDQLEIESNTILILEPGVTLRDAGRLGWRDRLLNIRTENVRISGLGARVVADRADYSTDEWRHGVYIYGARRVLVEGLESSSHGGDGFYIGGPPGNPSTDVILKGCRADNNRRQGLSITSARRVRVVDCEFMNTRGTAPQFGIDIEPNDPIDYADDIVILRPMTRGNFGGGIMIYLNGLSSTRVRAHPVDITILEHRSEQDAVHLWTQVPPEVTRVIRYQGTT